MREILRARLPNKELETVSLDELGSTRHQSAARLVDVNRSASVVTVSQDGNITLFIWDTELQAVVALWGLEDYLGAADEIYYR
jgi:hypothetical protein